MERLGTATWPAKPQGWRSSAVGRSRDTIKVRDCNQNSNIEHQTSVKIVLAYSAGLEEKALKTGATKCVIEDLQEEFARDFIFPMFQAGAIYENQYFLGTSIARPLIAKRMVEIARAERADAIAHGATGKGNDQVRFELTAAALAPELQVIAPWRDARYRNEFPGRAEMISYCEEKKIPVEASAKKPYSMDRNLLHISYE